MRATNDSEIACREIVEIITDYLEGALPESERVAFEAHLSTCDGCTTYLQGFRTTLVALPEACHDSTARTVQDDLLRLFGDWHRTRSAPED
jgi:anti-sigma factor RsiW